jgi:hypothetical protein
MKSFALIGGYEVLIDREDSDKVAEFGPWYMNSPSPDKKVGRFYFAHNLPERNGKRECVRLHRMITGATKGQIVDHINGDTLDCRKVNLRITDAHTNATNAKAYSENRGVNWDAEYSKWRARIQVNGKSVSLGRHDTKDQAIAAYKKAEKEYGYAEIRGRVTA